MITNRVLTPFIITFFLSTALMPVLLLPSEKNIALLEAVKKSNLDKAKELLQSGADPKSYDGVKTTVLHCACMFKDNPQMIELLVDAGADIEAKNNFGRSPIHSASEYHNLAVIKKLIQYGADTSVTDKKGKSALHYAYKHKLIDRTILRTLLHGGAPINASDNSGKTVMRQAIKNHDESLVYFLLKHGALPPTEQEMKYASTLGGFDPEKDAAIQAGISIFYDRILKTKEIFDSYRISNDLQDFIIFDMLLTTELDTKKELKKNLQEYKESQEPRARKRQRISY